MTKLKVPFALLLGAMILSNLGDILVMNFDSLGFLDILHIIATIALLVAGVSVARAWRRL